jgi:lysophospholipase L1-like esterase
VKNNSRMKKLNEKTIKQLLVLSIFFNILCFGYGIKKFSKIYKLRKARNEIGTNVQKDKLTYYHGRNDVFEKLPNTENEIIMVGNSLTNNFEWHEMFRDVNIINRGIGEDITKGVLQRLDEIVESKPLKIFLEIGINDFSLGYPIDTVFSNYVKIIDKIRLKSPQTKIYIQSILPCVKDLNSLTIDFNKRLKNYSIQSNITYIDLYSRFVSGKILNPSYDLGDGIHLSGEGYLLWCNLIKGYINE